MKSCRTWGKNFLMMLLSACLISCAIVQGKSSPSEYSSDAAITTKIKAKFVQSDMLSAPSIHVETQNKVVQISGFVSSPAQISKASEIAQSVEGVRSVVNDLVVQKARRNSRRG